MRIVIFGLLALLPILSVVVWPKKFLYLIAWIRYANKGRLDEIRPPRWAVYYLGYLEPEDKPYEAELLEDSVRTVGLATLVLPLFIGAFVFFVL